MKRAILRPFLFLPLTMILLACGGETPGKDSNEIQERSAMYVDAFNKQDLHTIAAQWSENTEYIDPFTGTTIQGRKAIEDQFDRLFQNLGNAELALNTESIVFPDAHTAIENGIAELTIPGKEIMETFYEAIYIKQNDQWLIAQINEIETFEPPTHYEQLQDLNWLVGEWIDEDEDVEITLTYAWDKYKNFLTQKFRVNAHDNKDLEGRQIIGWDPSKKEIRSWFFDSDGGFGRGVWSKKGDRWIAELAYTLPNGGSASAIHIYKKINENSYSFEATGREVDGEMLPNIGPVNVVKKKG